MISLITSITSLDNTNLLHTSETSDTPLLHADETTLIINEYPAEDPLRYCLGRFD